MASILGEDDDWLDAKLEEARKGAGRYGELRGLKEVADDEFKGALAIIREDAPKGSVADIDAWVRRQPEYRAAMEKKKNRYADFQAADIYMKLLFAQLDKYRTDKSYNKALDRAHR